MALNQLMIYPVANSRLSSTKQNGNIGWNSTLLIRRLTRMDKKELTEMVLLDMSKAFDSINHNILLMKLRVVGI